MNKPPIKAPEDETISFMFIALPSASQFKNARRTAAREGQEMYDITIAYGDYEVSMSLSDFLNRVGIRGTLQ